MKMKSTVLLLGVMLLSQTAWAGPPLLCHPFEIGSAHSLPWMGPNWKDSKPDYDVHHLVRDTLAVLDSDTPVIVRMETLRRAAIYAERSAQVAQELLSTLQRRAMEAKTKSGKAAPLALFDAGYLAETYKQSLNPKLN